jgi:hypothetical protein
MTAFERIFCVTDELEKPGGIFKKKPFIKEFKCLIFSRK